MRLTGYSDRWSVRPGETMTFHVHSVAPTYEARLVRLIHGDENPRGPGFKENEIDSSLDGAHPGAPRTIRKGSYGFVDCPLPDGTFGLDAWIWPTLPGPDPQGIMAWQAEDGESTVGLYLAADGRVECGGGSSPALRTARPVVARQWYHVALSIDRATGIASLVVRPKRWTPDWPGDDRAEGRLDGKADHGAGRLLFAAADLEATADGPRPVGSYNGKIARPRILDGEGKAVAAWDFGLKAGTNVLPGLEGAADGRTVNRPARAMTGPAWPGETLSTVPSPETHDAIHFHDDDVADVDWPVSHEFSIPADLASGVYALRLRAGDDEDYLPFFVCPPHAGTAPAPLAVLMPTMSYLAYANESLDVRDSVEVSPRQNMAITPERYAYVAENGLKSTYDVHSDGSGIAYGSRRRPIIDFRPKARCRTFDAPHQFAADLHLIDWLTTKGYAFDVITDDLLHEEGASLLDRHKVVITGSHPEYWTARMLDARDDWLDRGGRLMYLGGNGFYWVTGVAEDAPDVIEVRRYDGTRTWSGEPGEETVSVTGERGGLWRDRGRSPNERLGVAFTGQGFDRGTAYHRTRASYQPEWSWIFNGIDGDVVGDGPSLVLGHGAAGFEIDKADALNGTPPHAVILASTKGFTDAYQAAIECFPQVNPWLGGSDPRSGIRSDILLMHGPEGGAVFSAGSIIWSATLSASDYDSDTSRITANVLDAFLGETPLPGAAAANGDSGS